LLPSLFLVLDSAVRTFDSIPVPVLLTAGFLAAGRIGWMAHEQVAARRHIVERLTSIR
jgi:hypothetical protein